MPPFEHFKAHMDGIYPAMLKEQLEDIFLAVLAWT